MCLASGPHSGLAVPCYSTDQHFLACTSISPAPSVSVRRAEPSLPLPAACGRCLVSAVLERCPPINILVNPSGYSKSVSRLDSQFTKLTILLSVTNSGQDRQLSPLLCSPATSRRLFFMHRRAMLCQTKGLLTALTARKACSATGRRGSWTRYSPLLHFWSMIRGSQEPIILLKP